MLLSSCRIEVFTAIGTGFEESLDRKWRKNKRGGRVLQYLVTNLKMRWPLIPIWGLALILHINRDGQTRLWIQLFAVLFVLLILCPLSSWEKRNQSRQEIH
jgi:hypothetical protein